MSVSSIEEDVDSVDVMKYAGRRYFVVYIGGVDKAYEQLEKDIDSACSTLTSYRNKSAVKTAYSNESKYTLATYTKFSNAYDDAGIAITDAQNKATVANLNKVKTLYTDLQSAYTGLKLISSLSTTADRNDETSLVTAKIALRKLVNGTTTYEGKKVTTCISNKDTYSTATYATFNTALTNAKSLLRSTSATENKIENAETALKNAMKGLITKTEDTGRIEALKVLEDKIKEADELDKNKDAYNAAAYNIFSDYLKAAKVIKSSTTATEAEIKAVTDDLNDAIIMLSGSLKESSLNNLLQRAEEELEKTDVYMTATVTALREAYKAGLVAKGQTDNYTAIANATKTLESALSGLVNVNSELEKLVKRGVALDINDITSKNIDTTKLDTYAFTTKETYIKEFKILIAAEEKNIRTYTVLLKDAIQTASTKNAQNWNEEIYKATLAELNSIRAEAESVMNRINKGEVVNSKVIKAEYDKLDKALTEVK